MKVISVAMQKGGVGKSTLTRSLAVAAIEDGQVSIVLDMDPQQSSNKWGKRREDELPPVKFAPEAELDEILEKLRKSGCDLAIIDTPPARSSEGPAAIEAADLVLIPCTPDVEAYEQLPTTFRLCRTTATPAYGVLSMATPNGKAELEIAAEVFESVGLPLAPVVIHRRVIHRDASRQGLTAAEIEPDGKAAGELSALWQFCKRALVHNDERAHGDKEAA